MLQQQGQSGGNTVSPKEVDLAYNALGQFTTIADFNYLNGGPRMDIATGAYSYDTANRLTGMSYTSNAGANQIDAFGWGYDAANNVTSFSTNSSGRATYGNDATNQLTSASYTGTNQPANEAYSFDKNGNRTMAGYTTGSNNLLTSDGTFNYQHDADGNQTVRTRISSAYATDYQTTFAWDYRNRLTDVEYFDNNGVLTKHVHYVYGVFDHLLATEVDTTGSGSYDDVEHYVLDVSPEIPSAGVPGTALAQPLLQFNGGGAPTIRYLDARQQIFAEGDILSLTQGDVADFMLTDNLGTVRYLVDQSGTVVDKIDYRSFGQVSYESNPAIHHFAGFAGGHIDVGTGFIVDYHRWYDPATGRWMSRDPTGFAGHDTNLYRYADNAVTNGIDPLGLWTFSIGIGVSFTIPFYFGIGINVGGAINANLGPAGVSIAPSVNAGLGIGASAGIDVPVMITNAPDTAALTGLGYYGGVNVDLPLGGYAGYTYIPAGGYVGGTVAPGYGAGVSIIPYGYSWQFGPWWTWPNPNYSPVLPPMVTPPPVTNTQTNGPSSGNGGGYLNPGP